jgi:hypothetical protein
MNTQRHLCRCGTSIRGRPRVVVDLDPLPHRLRWRRTTDPPPLQRDHLAHVTREGQRHTEKRISPDLKNDEKTELSIWKIETHTLPSPLRRHHGGHRWCGSRDEGRFIYSNAASTTLIVHHNKQIITLTIRRRNKVLPPSCRRSGKQRGNQLSPANIGGVSWVVADSVREGDTVHGPTQSCRKTSRLPHQWRRAKTETTRERRRSSV